MSKGIGKQRRSSKSTLRKQAEEKLKELTTGRQQLSIEEFDQVVHELEVHQIELEMQNEQLRTASLELAESQRRYSDIYEFAPIGYFVLDMNGSITQVNLAGADLLGGERSRLTNRLFSRYVERHDRGRFNLHFRQVLETQCGDTCEIALNKEDGTVLFVQLKSQVGKDDEGNICQLLTAITDVTERTLAKNRQKFIIQILECANEQVAGESSLIRHVLGLLKEFTGIAAVGLRLRKDHDYPYLEVKGFSDRFVEAENHLCARNETGEAISDSQGHPVLACMCGCVLSGRTDPTLPYYTENGSFWTNSTTKLRSDFAQNHDFRFLRNQCNREGFESVALVPLRSNNDIIGLLQINDHRAGFFTAEGIHFFEAIGTSLGMALTRIRIERDIQKLNQELEQRVADRTAELEKSNKELRQQIRARERLETEILGISEREQKLLGQQLHDDVGQQYAGTALMLEALEEKLSIALPEEAPFVARIAKQVDTTMDHVRRITRGLAPVDFHEDNLADALKELSASTRELGIHCTCRWDKSISLSNTAMAINIYRITQEAITNAIKHGKTKNIQIKVTCNKDQIQLTVRNDGLDFQDVLPENKGMGLKIMHYRAELVNGSLNVCRDVKGGTIVTFHIPRQTSSSHEGHV